MTPVVDIFLKKLGVNLVCHDHAEFASLANFKGYVSTPATLPTPGQAGWFAVVGSTDTMWVWDSDTTAWVDTGMSSGVLSFRGEGNTARLGSIVFGAADLPNSGTWTLTGALNIVDSLAYNLFSINPTTKAIDSTIASILGTPATDYPTLGSEIIVGGSWTSTGWTGDNTVGWTNTLGNENPLSYSVAMEVGHLYKITVVYTGTVDPASLVLYTVGDAPQAFVENAAGTYTYSPKALTTTGLVVVPDPTFVGTLTFSIKEITAASTPVLSFKSSDSLIKTEIRTGFALRNTFIGVSSGRYNMAGINNTAVGYDALAGNTDGSYNVAIGYNALMSNSTGGTNVAIGSGSLILNDTGNSNIAIGPNHLSANVNGSSNVAIGNSCFSFGTTVSGCIGIGTWVGRSVTTGTRLIGMGTRALWSNTTGSDNIAIGSSSMMYLTTSVRNIGIGTNTLKGPSGGATGTDNTAIGYDALAANSSGTFNSAFGVSALKNNTTGSYNTAIGVQTLQSNTTGSGSTAVGLNALQGNTSGNDNTAIGYIALFSNSTGVYNTAVGSNALLSNSTGSNNTAIGCLALKTGGAHNYNTAIGTEALYSTVTGSQNTGIGYKALNATIGNANTAVGLHSLLLNGAGTGNTSIGLSSLSANVTGNYNVAIGYYAGAYETGSNAFYVDNQDRTNTAGDKSSALLYGTFNANPALQTLTSNSIFRATKIEVETANFGSGRTIGIRKNPLDGNECQFYADSILDLVFLGSGRIANVDGSGTVLASFRIDTKDSRIRFKDNMIFGETEAGVTAWTRFDTQIRIVSCAETAVPFRMVGHATQTGNLMEWKPSGELTTYGYMDATANLFLPGITLTSVGSAVTPFTIKGASGQSADLMQIKNSADAVMISVDANGVLNFGINNQGCVKIQDAGNASLTSGYNFLAVSGAGHTLTTGTQNVAIGYQANYLSETISYHVSLGHKAGYNYISTSGCTSIGGLAAERMRGAANTAIGYGSLKGSATASNNTGTYNVAIGYDAIGLLQSGTHNIGIGNQSLYNLSTGAANVAIGRSAGTALTTQSNCIHLGNYAGKYNTTGSVLIIDGFDRTDIAGEQTKSIIYGIMASTVAGQSLAINADALIVPSTNYQYWGDVATDGSWRFGRSGNNFVIERRESSAWVTKQTVSA